MIIRKLYKFENAHIVRGCSSQRCKYSIHGHSYKVEILLKSNFLDHGHMIYDFGLMKENMKDLIDSFDHATAIWNEDDKEYIESIKKHSLRWVSLPVSPSAEQFSRVIFLMIDKLLNLTKMANGEKDVTLYSVIVHETDTGYAQCFRDDAVSKLMGIVKLDDVVFSPQVQQEWKDNDLWNKILNNKIFINPKPN
jgi:6-pyruvoyltetrahydropterin/6-carboxytetrahydropterin synthase